MRSGSGGGPTGLPGRRGRPDLGLLVVPADLEDGGHGGLHPAGLVDTCLGLEVAGGLEFQAFVRASGDARAEAEGLFETSPKPVREKQRSVLFSLL